MPALLTFEQGPLWIAQVQTCTIFRQCPTQALVEVHRACLTAFALFGTERELCARNTLVINNIPTFQRGDFLGPQPCVEAEQDDGLVTSWMTTTAAVLYNATQLSFVQCLCLAHGAIP